MQSSPVPPMAYSAPHGQAQMQQPYQTQTCACQGCNQGYHQSAPSMTPSPTPSQSNWWDDEESACQPAPVYSNANRVSPVPPESFASRFDGMDSPQWNAHPKHGHSHGNMHGNHSNAPSPTPMVQPTHNSMMGYAQPVPRHPPHGAHHHCVPPMQMPMAAHHHQHPHSNVPSTPYSPASGRRASYSSGMHAHTMQRPQTYTHLPVHGHNNNNNGHSNGSHPQQPSVLRTSGPTGGHQPLPPNMQQTFPAPQPVMHRRNSMPVSGHSHQHPSSALAPVVPGVGPQEACRIRFVNAKCWSHDPYSETAYRAMPKSPLTTATCDESVVGTVCEDVDIADQCALNSPRSSPPTEGDDSIRPSFSHSSSFSDFSPMEDGSGRKTFTEEELINSPDEVIASAGTTTDEDGSCWVEVLVGTDGMRKRRYRHSGILPCSHRAFAKRLRYRRGWTYFMCVECGFKWGEAGVR